MKQFEIIRTLVVDDSSFMRNSLSHILESDSSIEVVGTACDGAEAVKKVKSGDYFDADTEPSSEPDYSYSAELERD